MTENELIVKAKSGDTLAFAKIIRENQNRIYALCLKMTKNREDAEDLTQETFLKAWKNIELFKGESSFATWIYRLCNNTCLDFLRAKKRRVTVLDTDALENSEGQTIEIADNREEPHKKLEQKERQELLENALEKLSETHKNVLIMREISGLSYNEIAEVLELDLGTVKSRISRAKISLRKILLDDGNFFEEFSSINNEKEKLRKGE